MENEVMYSGVKTFTLCVPGHVVGQGRPRYSGRTGRFHDPKQSVEAKHTVKTLAIERVKELDWKIAQPDMPVTMRIVAYKEIPTSKPTWFKEAAKFGLVVPLTKPDCDNVEKLVMDALNGIVYHDDKQVFDCHYTAFYSDEPRLEIEVKGLFVNVGDVKEAVRKLKALKK